METVEGVQYDVAETLYVFRKGLPPRGFRAHCATISDEPYIPLALRQAPPLAIVTNGAGEPEFEDA